MEKEPEIVFEDKNLLLLSKPTGWVSSKERRGEKNPTVEEWLTGKVDPGLARNGLVHRLDKGTSGLLLVAKNIKSLLNLKKQFKQRRVKKKYWALVGGDVVSRGVIEVPIGRSRFDKFGVKIGGKLARSEFCLIKKYKKEGKIYSLVEIELKTGRTHQIRVHMSYLGWPLWGDWRYGGEKGEGDRLFLQAFFLEFNNPGKKKKRMSFKLPLAVDLKKILEGYEEI